MKTYAICNNTKLISIGCLLMLLAQPTAIAFAEPEGWSEASSVSSLQSGSISPAIVSQGENLLVFWSSFRDGYYRLLCRKSSNGGTVWNQEQILFQSECDALFPSVAMSETTIYLTWIESSSKGQGKIVFSKSTDNADNWQTPTIVSDAQARTTSAGITATASVVHITWADARSGVPNVLYAVSTDSGENWSTAKQVTTESAYCWYPSIASNGTGVFLVWESWSEGVPEIRFAKSTDNGDSWGSQRFLSTLDDYSSERPVIAATQNRIHVAWQDESEEGYAIKHTTNMTATENWSGMRITSKDAGARLPEVACVDSAVMLLYQHESGHTEELYLMESPNNGSAWSTPVAFSHQDGAWSSLAAATMHTEHKAIAWADIEAGTPTVQISLNPDPASSIFPSWLLY